MKKLRVAFYASTNHRFDLGISGSMRGGVRACGDRYSVLSIADYRGEPSADVDVACFMGVKNKSRLVYDSYRAAGKHTLVFDKGYTRLGGGALGTLYWRAVLDDFQPAPAVLRAAYPTDRWDRLNLTIKPQRRARKGCILFCGGSQKYCNWHDLGDANQYARSVLDAASAYTSRELVYRPKPSWSGALSLAGYGYSDAEARFRNELERTFHVVTFGSNAAFEALLAGVPALVLGDGVAQVLARTSLADIEDPLYPDVDEVYRLGCAVAYHQWTLAELDDGTFWRYLRERLLPAEA